MGIDRGMMMAMFLILDGFGDKAHVIGTGFGVVTPKGETFLVTNQHVARVATKDWKEHIHIKVFTLNVTDDESQNRRVNELAIPAALIAVTEKEEETNDGWDLVCRRTNRLK